MAVKDEGLGDNEVSIKVNKKIQPKVKHEKKLWRNLTACGKFWMLGAFGWQRTKKKVWVHTDLLYLQEIFFFNWEFPHS